MSRSLLSSTPGNLLDSPPSVGRASSRNQIFLLPPDWPLQYGGRLPRGRLAYEWTGPSGAPVVVVQGGISAGCHVAATEANPDPGWWEPFVGPGKAIDTERFQVLSFDFLGGNGGSSGRGDADQDFVAVGSQDQARACLALLSGLGIDRIHTFIGSSYGGMIGLALAALAPRVVERLLAISAADRTHPQATAWRSLQRSIVRLARERGAEWEGLVLGRALAMVTYRSPAELLERFSGPPTRDGDQFRFPVQEYLEARGRAFADSFDAQAFLDLSQSIDLHEVDPSLVSTPTTLVGVRTDQLVPIEQMRSLAQRLGSSGRLVEIESLYGHDAFLKEEETLNEILTDVLSQGVSRS